jgi:hypothetical protein
MLCTLVHVGLVINLIAPVACEYKQLQMHLFYKYDQVPVFYHKTLILQVIPNYSVELHVFGPIELFKPD